MSVQTSLREFQKTLPPRVEANMAELEFPNMVPANLAAVERTENSTISPFADLMDWPLSIERARLNAAV